MKFKKLTSILLSVAIMLTVICGCFAVTADAASTITYSFIVKTSETVNGFEGELSYPNTLSVTGVTFSGQYNDTNGKILFNSSNASDGFSFTNGANLITVVFKVLGDYNASDISCDVAEFYSNASVMSGNIPFYFENVIDGETVSRGYNDIDVPANNYTDFSFL